MSVPAFSLPCFALRSVPLSWIGLDWTELNDLLVKSASLPSFVCLDFLSPLVRSLATSSPRPQETKQTVVRGYTAGVPILSPRRPCVPPDTTFKTTSRTGVSLLFFQTVREDRVPQIMD